MEYLRRGNDDYPAAGDTSSLTEIEPGRLQGQAPIEAAKSPKKVTAHQQGHGRDKCHLPDDVVLLKIKLARIETRIRISEDICSPTH
jgi:hypothetical protein